MTRLPIRCFWLVLLLAAPALRAQSVSMSTLQNLPALTVTVRGLSVDGEALGLTKDELIRTVTRELNSTHLTIVTAAQAEKLPGAPALEITANVSKISARGFLFILGFQLRENVTLARKTRNLVNLPAVTWEVQAGGYTGKPEVVYDSLTTLAQKFVTEWSEANPPGPVK